jgi:hypothetical protein
LRREPEVSKFDDASIYSYLREYAGRHVSFNQVLELITEATGASREQILGSCPKAKRIYNAARRQR